MGLWRRICEIFGRTLRRSNVGAAFNDFELLVVLALRGDFRESDSSE